MTTDPEETHPVELTVNGRPCLLDVRPRERLVDLLRTRLGLPGTTVGCETGHCGSCTVLLDGSAVRSCVVLGVQADGGTVETVESLAADGELAPLQSAFSSSFALQCGFCTPGMLMLATELLRDEPAPTRERVTECVAANLCRCTGYEPIVDAITSCSTPSPEDAP